MTYTTYPFLHDLHNTYDSYLDNFRYIGSTQDGMLLVNDRLREAFGEHLTDGTWHMTGELKKDESVVWYDPSILAEGMSGLRHDYAVAMGGVLLIFEMNRREFHNGLQNIITVLKKLKKNDAVTHMAKALEVYAAAWKGTDQTDACKESLRLLTKAIDLHRQNPIVYLHIGHVLHYQPKYRDFTKAWDNYNLCYTSSADDAALAPIAARGCFYSGWLSAAVFGNLQESITWIKRALEKEPGFAEAHYCLMKLHALVGSSDDASAHLRHLLEQGGVGYCHRLKDDKDFHVFQDDLRPVFYEILKKDVSGLEKLLQGDEPFSDAMRMLADDRIAAAKDVLDGGDAEQCMNALVLIDDAARKAELDRNSQQKKRQNEKREQDEDELKTKIEEERRRSEEEERMKAELKERMEQEMKERTKRQNEQLRRKKFIKTLISIFVFIMVVLTFASFLLYGINLVGFAFLVLANIGLLVRAFI